MIHQFRDKKQTARRASITQVIVLVCLFIFLSFGIFLHSSGRLLSTLGRPIWSLKTATVHTADSVANFFRTKASLYNQINTLKIDNNTLLSQMTDYEIIKNENDQLKELMGRLPNTHNFLLATILAKPDLSPYDTIIVDAGSALGINVGQSVYANATVPIGTINKVYGDTSLVVLYSNPGQLTEATLDGSNNSVELIGRGGGNFSMKIPQELVVDKGTLVILPKAHSVGNEIVAIVEEVTSSPNDPYKVVLLRSPVNIQDLKWVEIEK